MVRLPPGGIVPDAVTVGKGLGGGLPIGACIAFGDASVLLGPGSHGSTFGGNPLAAAAGIAVLDTVEAEELLANVRDVGDRLRAGVGGLDHPLVSGTRGIGLLLAVELTAPVASGPLRPPSRAGFIVNAVAPDALRLAPPLILTAGQAREFVAALPGILDDIRED